MGSAQDAGPGAPADRAPDQLTGARSKPLTSFIGRSRELDELRSLFRAGKRNILGLVAFPHIRKRAEQSLAIAGLALGDENFKKAFEEGGRLSVEESVAFARRGHGKHAGATYGWASLSPADQLDRP